MQAKLCQLAETYRTDHDAEDARRLGLGKSAFEYRHVDEHELVALEMEGTDTPEAELRRARNRRYYERRRALQTVTLGG